MVYLHTASSVSGNINPQRNIGAYKNNRIHTINNAQMRRTTSETKIYRPVIPTDSGGINQIIYVSVCFFLLLCVTELLKDPRLILLDRLWIIYLHLVAMQYLHVQIIITSVQHDISHTHTHTYIHRH